MSEVSRKRICLGAWRPRAVDCRLSGVGWEVIGKDQLVVTDLCQKGEENVDGFLAKWAEG